MRTDVKIGIAVGVLVLLVAAIYVAATNKKTDADNGKAPGIARTDGGDSGKPEIKIEPPPSGTPATIPPAAAPSAPVSATPSLANEPSPSSPPSHLPVAETPAPPGASHAASVAYTVLAGDTLWKIAQKQYGDAKYIDLLKSANPGVKSETLRVGQTLTLPPKPSEAGNAKPVAALPTGAKDYTVVSGDNLTSIAEKHYGSGKYWTQIASANPETKGGSVSLKIGQKLVIPALKDVTPTSAPAGLAHSATTRPADGPAARRASPTDNSAVSSTASAAPERPDFSSRLR